MIRLLCAIGIHRFWRKVEEQFEHKSCHAGHITVHGFDAIWTCQCEYCGRFFERNMGDATKEGWEIMKPPVPRVRVMKR